jgi:cobalt-precorrin 5A hydrolase/precorrin-3B C17-methyltransferase
MASLVYEVLDQGNLGAAERRVAVTVVPGISAFQAAAARAGAPIGHDFCAISLSDLLTPWEVIERRLRAAAEGDFVVALYNPRSRKRVDQLVRALEILSGHRPPGTPVILATNLGRADERLRVVGLSTFDPEEVDMLTVVMIGASQSRILRLGDGKDRVYTPRGYAAKREGRT